MHNSNFVIHITLITDDYYYINMQKEIINIHKKRKEKKAVLTFIIPKGHE